MEWFIAVVVVAILGVAAMAAAGGMGEMAREPVRDTFDPDLPTDRPLVASDLSSLRFGVGLRGYSMSQVDDLLDRLTAEIAVRDAALAQLATGAAGAAQAEHRASGDELPAHGEPDDSPGPEITGSTSTSTSTSKDPS